MQDTHEIDIHSVLAARRQIAIVWSTKDVQEVRPDMTDDQAWEVLQQVECRQDAMLGVDQDLLECFATDLFGHPPDDKTETAG